MIVSVHKLWTNLRWIHVLEVEFFQLNLLHLRPGAAIMLQLVPIGMPETSHGGFAYRACKILPGFTFVKCQIFSRNLDCRPC